VDSNLPYCNDVSVPNLTKQRRNPTLLAFGEAVRRIRLEKEISQEGLALVAGVDRSYIGRIERGDNNAALLTLVKIAGALDVSVARLMDEASL
jgi:transcriptional regulator with XRE-family HTH domain